MEADISNKTIVVLVVLTVIISILSTLVVLNEISTVKFDSVKQSKTQSSSVGQVKLEIRPEPGQSQATGMVVLNIRPEQPQ
jgi:hypothetical protein